MFVKQERKPTKHQTYESWCVIFFCQSLITKADEASPGNRCSQMSPSRYHGKRNSRYSDWNCSGKASLAAFIQPRKHVSSYIPNHFTERTEIIATGRWVLPFQTPILMLCSYLGQEKWANFVFSKTIPVLHHYSYSGNQKKKNPAKRKLHYDFPVNKAANEWVECWRHFQLIVFLYLSLQSAALL